MIEYLKGLELWQQIVLGVLVVLVIFSFIMYIREVVMYKKRKKVKVIPLNLLRFTQDNYLYFETRDETSLAKTFRVYLNDERSKFKLDEENDDRLFVQASDIFLNEFELEFISDRGITYAKGVINIDDTFPRPYGKKSLVPEAYVAPVEKPVAEEAPVEEPVVEEVVEETPVEEPVVEEVVEETPVEEPVEEVVEETPAEEPVEEVVEEEQPEEASEETAEEIVAEESNDGESDEAEIIIENGKKIIITYNYSLQARLIQADSETQDWYKRLLNEMDSYKDLKYKESWKKIRVYKGRKTLATIKFRGKKMFIAYALDPKKYEETKYKGVDMSEKKSYQDTPLMLKTTSERRFVYQLKLLNDVCQENDIQQGEVVQKEIAIEPYMTKDELIEKQLVKVNRKEVLL